MQPNYWKFATIVLFVALLFGGLFFLIQSSRNEHSFLAVTSSAELNGEVFIVTRGNGNVKIGLAEITIENQTTKQSFKVTSNADGKFSIIAPAGMYALNAKATRTYQQQLSGDSDKQLLDKNVVNNSLEQIYRDYDLAISLEHLSKSAEFSRKGITNSEVLARNFLQISEYYNWKLDISLNQSKQSLQLSNNNLSNFGLKK